MARKNGRMKEPRARRSKYHNRKTIVNGITFASRAEAQYYVGLCEKLVKEEILFFERQVPFTLIDSYINGEGKKIRAMTYVCDFVVTLLDGTQEIIDVKGSRGYLTPDFKLKKKWFDWKYYPKYIKIVAVKV